MAWALLSAVPLYRLNSVKPAVSAFDGLGSGADFDRPNRPYQNNREADEGPAEEQGNNRDWPAMRVLAHEGDDYGDQGNGCGQENCGFGHNVESLVGIPYRDHGRTRAGLDCWGLVWLAMRELAGVETPSYAETYPRGSDIRHVSGVICAELPKWQQIHAAKAGAVALFRRTGMPAHVGYCIDRQRMLHVDLGGLSCIERLDSMRWRRRIEGFYVPA